MTKQHEPRALDAALAKTLGMPLSCYRDHQNQIQEHLHGHGADGRWYACESIPAWSSSLDAMRDVEEELERRGLKAPYVSALEEALGAIAPDRWPEGPWRLIHASAAQRATAALAVLEGARGDE